MEDIEYLEEYENIVKPKIRSEAPLSSFGNKKMASIHDDDDSSSIDQDMFESLFNDNSDESSQQGKEESKIRRNKERESSDSLDMLMRDFGEQLQDNDAQRKRLYEQSCHKSKKVPTRIVNATKFGSSNAVSPPQVGYKANLTCGQGKVKSIATVRPTVQNHHKGLRNITSVHKSDCRMGLSSASLQFVSSAVSSRPVNINKPSVKKLNRHPPTIIKPEKTQSKDPVEDPLSLDALNQFDTDSDSDSFTLSDISDDDTIGSLSDWDEDVQNEFGLLDDSENDMIARVKTIQVDSVLTNQNKLGKNENLKERNKNKEPKVECESEENLSKKSGDSDDKTSTFYKKTVQDCKVSLMSEVTTKADPFFITEQNNTTKKPLRDINLFKKSLGDSKREKERERDSEDSLSRENDQITANVGAEVMYSPRNKVIETEETAIEKEYKKTENDHNKSIEEKDTNKDMCPSDHRKTANGHSVFPEVLRPHLECNENSEKCNETSFQVEYTNEKEIPKICDNKQSKDCSTEMTPVTISANGKGTTDMTNDFVSKTAASTISPSSKDNSLHNAALETLSQGSESVITKAECNLKSSNEQEQNLKIPTDAQENVDENRPAAMLRPTVIGNVIRKANTKYKSLTTEDCKGSRSTKFVKKNDKDAAQNNSKGKKKDTEMELTSRKECATDVQCNINTNTSSLEQAIDLVSNRTMNVQSMPKSKSITVNSDLSQFEKFENSYRNRACNSSLDPTIETKHLAEADTAEISYQVQKSTLRVINADRLREPSVSAQHNINEDRKLKRSSSNDILIGSNMCSYPEGDHENIINTVSPIVKRVLPTLVNNKSCPTNYNTTDSKQLKVRELRVRLNRHTVALYLKKANETNAENNIDEEQQFLTDPKTPKSTSRGIKRKKSEIDDNTNLQNESEKSIFQNEQNNLELVSETRSMTDDSSEKSVRNIAAEMWRTKTIKNRNVSNTKKATLKVSVQKYTSDKDLNKIEPKRENDNPSKDVPLPLLNAIPPLTANTLERLLSNTVGGSPNAPISVLDSNGTRIYSFLYPAEKNKNHEGCLLDYCCPNLDGPMPAIDPTRIHKQIQRACQELPAYIVMTTKVITRAELDNAESIPAAIRQKVEKLKGNTTQLANNNTSNVTTECTLQKIPANEKMKIGTASSALKQLTPRKARNLNESRMRRSLKCFDSVFCKCASVMSDLSLSERQLAVDHMVATMNFTTTEVDIAVKILEDYSKSLSSRLQAKQMTTSRVPTLSGSQDANNSINPQNNKCSSAIQVPIYDSEKNIIGYQLQIGHSGKSVGKRMSTVKRVHNSPNKEAILDKISNLSIVTPPSPKLPIQDGPRIFYTKSLQQSTSRNQNLQRENCGETNEHFASLITKASRQTRELSTRQRIASQKMIGASVRMHQKNLRKIDGRNIVAKSEPPTKRPRRQMKELTKIVLVNKSRHSIDDATEECILPDDNNKAEIKCEKDDDFIG